MEKRKSEKLRGGYYNGRRAQDPKKNSKQKEGFVTFAGKKNVGRENEVKKAKLKQLKSTGKRLGKAPKKGYGEREKGGLSEGDLCLMARTLPEHPLERNADLAESMKGNEKTRRRLRKRVETDGLLKLGMLRLQLP